MIKASNFTPSQLEEFRQLQRKSFAILEQTAANLAGGESEKDVAHELVRLYRAAGAESFFHLPVVLFGDRTALQGEWPVNKFFPRNRKLEAGASVILDAAAIIGGFLVDTSYSFCLGNNNGHREMMRHLSQYRASIPLAINRGERFKSIAETVHRSIVSAEYEAVHDKHPGQVLGHRAVKLPNLPIKPRLRGFDAVALTWFRAMDTLAMSGIGMKSPLWNTLKASDHRAHDGLWLVEPHAGCGDIGAKWEEILVVEDGKARWLDDKPPHVYQWACINEGADYGPFCGRQEKTKVPL